MTSVLTVCSNIKNENSFLRDGAVGCGSVLRAVRSQVRFPMGLLGYFLNTSGRTMTLESTQPLTEIITRSTFFGS